MNITHHPSDETLASFAAGTLDEARSVVVAAHVSLCPHCQRTMRAFEQVGGALLDRAEPAALSADAFERTLDRIERDVPAQDDIDPAHSEIELPAPLSGYHAGPWRKIGYGVQWRSVDVPSSNQTRVFMLKAAPGTRLPHHRHAGVEWTCILEGAFRHDLGRFGPGDFDEADETVEHNPVVEEGTACICLVALQGQIELQGWFGRIIQPFVRI